MTGTAGEEVGRIAALGLPVLFPDTCFLLDDPTRPTVRPEYREAAVALVDAMASRAVVGFIAPQVVTELNGNRSKAESEAAEALRKLAEELRRMDEVLSVYGGAGRSDIGHLFDHGPCAKKLLDRWLPSFSSAPEPVDIGTRAFARIALTRTPARKGSASAQDCVVTETYLDLATKLRGHGLTASIVFASSNTRDYCETTGSNLKADLAREFAACRMEFAPNFGAARFLLGV